MNTTNVVISGWRNRNRLRSLRSGGKRSLMDGEDVITLQVNGIVFISSFTYPSRVDVVIMVTVEVND